VERLNILQGFPRERVQQADSPVARKAESAGFFLLRNGIFPELPAVTPPQKPIIQQIQRECLADTVRVALYKDAIRFPSGKDGVHWVVHYKRHGVGVIPVLEDGRLLLGLHHRYTTNVWGWEIVAGSMDPGESPEETAHRELLEETSCSAGSLQFLFQYNPAPGLGDEVFHAFLAKELCREESLLDTDEIHELRPFTWEEIVALIESGEMKDGFSITLLSYARARGLI
jgi:ADP-ribose pyrophosphatase